MRRAAAVLASLTAVAAFLPVLSTVGPAAASGPSTVGPAAASGSLAAGPAAAAPATVTWTVQPATAAGPDGRRWIERTLDPGQQVTEHLAVRNLGDATAVFTLSAADGYLTDKGRFNMLPADRKSVDSGTWITIPPTVTVRAGGTAVVPFTIDVPAEVTPGDHPAGIAASIAGTQGTVHVESRVGFRLMLRASGVLRPELTPGRIETTYERSWNPLRPGRLTVVHTVTNTGNVRVQARSRITAGTGAATADLGELLPTGARTNQTVVDGVWPLARIVTTVHLEPTVPGDTEARPAATATVTTWVVPWPQLLALAVVGLFLAAWRLRRRRLAAMLARAREEGRRSVAA
jgi:hypothetical protein